MAGVGTMEALQGREPRRHSHRRRACGLVGLALVALGAGCAGRVGDDTALTEPDPVASVVGVVPARDDAPTSTSTAPSSSSTVTSTSETTTSSSTTVLTISTTTTTEPYTAPLGTPQDLGDWTVTVTAVEPDATARVLAENMFNEPPTSGAYAVVDVTATYGGSTSGTPFDVGVSMINGEGQVVEPFSFATSPVCPNDLLHQPTVVTGGTISGSVCLDIATYRSGIVNVTTGWGRDIAYWQALPRP